MTVDPLVLVAEVDRATERLLRTAARLDEAALAVPSLLPGWTRGHVLAHIARNADSMVNLFTSARTGQDIPQYPSDQARDAEIARDADRPPAVHLDDLRGSAARFADAVAQMPPDAWAATVPARGERRPAATLVWGRLREVEVHHVDLDAGYTTADWPEAFSHHLLHELVTGMSRRAGVPAMVLRPTEARHDLTIGEPEGAPVVSGAAHELAGWLAGRSAGATLTVTPPGDLPTPPEWI
ncbi:MAG TPA: maleylpyruvate isomerase family mycothiol-dependent enzyme [Micromonospora sp.]